MSLKLDKEVNEPSDLTDEEYTILQAQGRLPKGFPHRPELVKQRNPSPFQANTGTVAVMSTEELEAELERRKALETQPSIGDNGGIQDEDAEMDYSEMSNKELRAELANRGLSVDGNKAELVARLEEDDEADDSDGE